MSSWPACALETPSDRFVLHERAMTPPPGTAVAATDGKRAPGAESAAESPAAPLRISRTVSRRKIRMKKETLALILSAGPL